MQLTTIVLKICFKPALLTSKLTCHLPTSNTSNHYQIMRDRSKQIIPNLDAVVSCFDRAILEVL